MDKLWTYLIHLSTNFWADAGAEFVKTYHEKFDTDEKVWREVIDFLPQKGFNALLIDLGDAIVYDSHPEIAIEGAWSKDKLKQELDYIRNLGLTPIPKLNFSTCHDVWMGEYAKMVSTQKYYEVCADLIKEVTELFDSPEYFHLGMDEEIDEGQKPFMLSIARHGDLWWHDVYKLFDMCDANGVRPWVWADRYWNHPEEYLKKMPKSVLQSNWWYGHILRNEDGTCKDPQPGAYIDLDKAGYEQVLTGSTWSYQRNYEDTFQIAKEITPELCKGVMAAPWQLTTEEDYYTLLNDAHRFGIAKEKHFPDL